MIRAFFSVGLWTIVSRATGFVRDILLASLLGTGMLMDAFTVAFRLPNHFRAIFGEGAFNTAFVPAFTRVRTELGRRAAAAFHGRVLSFVVLSQLGLLAAVLAFMPGFVRLLAPGFIDRPETLKLAIELTAITFPYLALITLVVLWAGVLNAEQHFVAGAAAPVLLNLAMIGTLLAARYLPGVTFSGLNLANWNFPTLAHAAAWGVLIAGFLEAGLLALAARRAGLLAKPRLPKLDPEIRRFFRAFGPAVIGKAGAQIALLADTIIVTFLPQGGASSLYYADRLYQLPVGVVGIAAGTVLLPEMARLLTEGRTTAAHHQQNRVMVLSILLAAPFFVGFLVIPDPIVAAMFQRGVFDAAATAATAGVLQAYAFGLPAIVLISGAVASFHARGDTTTPLFAALAGIAINLALKLVLWRDFGAAGLALATAFGWSVNFAILMGLAIRQKKAAPDAAFTAALGVIAGAALGLGFVLVMTNAVYGPLAPLYRLLVTATVGALFYGGTVYLGFHFLRLPLALR